MMHSVALWAIFGGIQVVQASTEERNDGGGCIMKLNARGMLFSADKGAESAGFCNGKYPPRARIATQMYKEDNLHEYSKMTLSDGKEYTFNQVTVWILQDRISSEKIHVNNAELFVRKAELYNEQQKSNMLNNPRVRKAYLPFMLGVTSMSPATLADVKVMDCRLSHYAHLNNDRMLEVHKDTPNKSEEEMKKNMDIFRQIKKVCDAMFPQGSVTDQISLDAVSFIKYTIVGCNKSERMDFGTIEEMFMQWESFMERTCKSSFDAFADHLGFPTWVYWVIAVVVILIIVLIIFLIYWFCVRVDKTGVDGAIAREKEEFDDEYSEGEDEPESPKREDEQDNNARHANPVE